MKSFILSKKWIQNKIFWLLLLVPLSFKIEVLPKVILLPQEFLLPILLGLYFITKLKVGVKYPKYLAPFIYLLLAFAVTFVFTIFSFIEIFDIVGLLKLIKYSIYGLAIFSIYDYRSENFVTKFNKITVATIISTLVIFIFIKVDTGYSWHTFMEYATYNSNFMPTGFSNRIFNFASSSFVIYSGNHGIYGSYLVLALMLNLSALINGVASKLTKITIGLVLLNIMLLTSRETFLLLFLIFFFYSLYFASFTKFKLSNITKVLFIFFGGVSLLVFVIIYFEIELSIVNKIVNSIEGFKERGSDGSVDVRFNTWTLIILFFIHHPLRLLIGTGFNEPLFRSKIDEMAIMYPDVGKYVGIPESLFLGFLGYGGILALVFVLLFLLSAFKNLSRKRKTVYGMFMSFYVLGIMVTNNTGASIIADILLTQFGLVYLFIMNSQENEVFVHNS